MVNSDIFDKYICPFASKIWKTQKIVTKIILYDESIVNETYINDYKKAI